MLKKHWKGLLLSIGIALLAGVIGMFLGGNMDSYSSLNKPPLTPPKILFPIMWTILYILMGISAYMVYQSDTRYKTKAIVVYIIQLIINSLWTLFFFRLNLKLFAFIWLVFLIIVLLNTIYRFYKICKTAAILQIPYLLWLLFASYLNYAIYYLNH